MNRILKDSAEAHGAAVVKSRKGGRKFGGGCEPVVEPVAAECAVEQSPCVGVGASVRGCVVNVNVNVNLDPLGHRYTTHHK